MTRAPLLLAILALALGVHVDSGVAQSSKDMPGRITPTSATSACVGQASTPVCAAETLLACVARGDARLCRAVTASPPASMPNGVPLVEYVIERVSVIRAADVTDDLKDLEWYKPGYTLIELLRRACPANQADCSEETWEGVQVYARPRAVGDGWEIVYWRADGEQDVPPEEPENFQTATMPAR